MRRCGDSCPSVNVVYQLVWERDHSTAMAEEGGGRSRNGDSAGRELEEEQLCDAFLDRFTELMDHRNVKSMLAEQEHM